MEEKLKKEVAALFDEKKIDYFVGYAKGSLMHKTTPLITKDKEEALKTVINPFIYNNLACYLRELPGRVGVVVKGCDSRSVVSLLQDNQIFRENLTIIGIPCSGLIDLEKVVSGIQVERHEITSIERQGDKVAVKAGGKEKTFEAEDLLFDKCLNCVLPVPKEADIMIGDKDSPPVNKEKSYHIIKKLKEEESAERWNFWKDQFKKCIRCYACRNVCPACSCTRCFVEVNRPQWVSPVQKWQDNLVFQMIRTIHVAGRCVDCGECERACPASIPLRSLQREMGDNVKELFGFESGMDKDEKPLIASYKDTDPNEFMR
ncbi:MAG: 4Fe-4S dicluster domain-containing protein [Thermodesulfobacteriota bacterium]|nr:4Fe-4S dicluster domain-containing protein [Thermodesulfobacteriota bacterium]